MTSPRPSDPARSSKTKLAWLLAALGVAAFAQLAFLAIARTWFPRVLPGATLLSGWPLTMLQAWALAAVLVLLWRVVLVLRYRPAAPVGDDELPSVTVIVPAFNEGAQVYETIRTLVASDYPQDRLHVVAVDDGSEDDTWRWIARGKAHFGERVTAVRCRENRGKRAALSEGFARATGEILVTVDSDSEVLPDTLRELVAPLVRDARVGAVAGNVRVLNVNHPMARMLDVAFTFAFDFMRASESEVDTVTCCPGALSAWRRTLVDEVREEWNAQTFLGEPASIGEDRAMTNFVLRRGFHVKYQSTAIVLTEVPTTFQQLSRMLLRWARSDVRESLVLASFVFGRFRTGSAWGARFNCAWAMTGTLLRGALFLPTLASFVLVPAALGWFLVGALVSAVVPAAVFAATRSDGARGLWAVPYALYAAVFLSWVGPWGLVTPHRSAWLTRGRKKAAMVPALESEAG